MTSPEKETPRRVNVEAPQYELTTYPVASTGGLFPQLASLSEAELQAMLLHQRQTQQPVNPQAPAMAAAERNAEHFPQFNRQEVGK